MKYSLPTRVFALIFSFLLLLSGCSAGHGGSILVQPFLNREFAEFYPQEVQSALHTVTNGGAEKEFVAKSGLISLYYDPVTSAVSVQDTGRKKLWSALPAPVAGQEERSAAVLTLTVREGDRFYYMNSQDNSVAFGRNEYTLVRDESRPAEKGIELYTLVCKYALYPDRETAERTAFLPEDVAFLVTVTYQLADGSLYVNLTHENLSGNPKARIETLGLLEYFGAYAESGADDFLLVPDGCGAAVKTGEADAEYSPQVFRVYGEDASLPIREAQGAVMPAYGIRQADGGFVALVEQGDALAEIHCDRVRKDSNYNYVGARFRLTPYVSIPGKKETDTYLAAESYSGELGLCMRFISGSGASVGSMASAVREQLIRNQTLSTKTVAEQDALPFHLSLLAAAPQKLFTLRGKTAAPRQMLTTFAQAQTIVERLKGKGVNNLSLRYQGAFGGLIGAADSADAHMLTRLGGKEGYRELQRYIEAQNMALYLDFGLLTRGSSTPFSGGKNAVSLNEEAVSVTRARSSDALLGTPPQTQKLRSYENLEKTVISILSKLRNLETSGICLNDVGELVYADYSAPAHNRQAAAETLAEQVTALSTNRKLMVTRGNSYTLKNVSAITELPLHTVREPGVAYQELPFVQMVLHGIVDYSGEPINYSKNRAKTMLRFLEFGALPSFEWCFEETMKTGAAEDLLYYEDWLQEASDFYAKANRALLGLRGARITAYTQPAENLFCTEYETGARIYVNYAQKDITLDGLTVKAMDFLRVN